MSNFASYSFFARLESNALIFYGFLSKKIVSLTRTIIYLVNYLCNYSHMDGVRPPQSFCEHALPHGRYHRMCVGSTFLRKSVIVCMCMCVCDWVGGCNVWE